MNIWFLVSFVQYSIKVGCHNIQEGRNRELAASRLWTYFKVINDEILENNLESWLQLKNFRLLPVVHA